MAVDAETVIDRRRLRRRLTFWRIAAVVLGLLLVAAVLVANQKITGAVSPFPQIARISLSGIITDDHDTIELLDKVANADQVKAIILDINSPGGTTTGGEAIFDAIRRASAKKPVVAVCGTMATSAAYLAALATDRIFVYGNTITGSVGVIFEWVDLSGLLDKLGVKVEEVRSGPLKAVPDMFQPADDKARALSQDMVDDAKVWFFGLVADRRKVDPKTVPGLTDGRIYSGRQALQLKLVDEIGDEKAAVHWLEQDRKIAHGLSILDWQPDTDNGGVLSWLFHSMASAIGVSSRSMGILFGQMSASLKLDGLISVWHPA